MNIELDLPTLHPGQQHVFDNAADVNILVMGRRWGKTLFGQDLVVHPILEGYPVGWFAPNYKFLNEVWRNTVRTLRPIISRSSKTEKQIEFITGGVLDFWTLAADDDPGRGRAYKRIIIDEAAIARNLEAQWQYAIQPTLLDYGGDAFFFSTPNGLNYFHTLHTQALERDNWRTFHAPTISNPTIAGLAEWITERRADTLARVFQQEYNAEFVIHEGAVFHTIKEVAILEPSRPQLHQGHTIVFGADLAELSDFSVVSGFCSTCMQQVFMDRFNQISYPEQRARLKALRDRWKPDIITIEENSIGRPFIQDIQNEGVHEAVGFKTTSTSKAPFIQAYQLALDKQELLLLNDPILINEHLAYERTSTPAGNPIYSHPPGVHDDTVMAGALGYHGILSGDGGAMEFA